MIIPFKTLMVQGATAGAGKSIVVTALRAALERHEIPTISLQLQREGVHNEFMQDDGTVKAREMLESCRSAIDQDGMVLVEGCRAAAEIRPGQHDMGNMGFAAAVDCPVILVADMDRGGMFAQIIGTLSCFSENDRRRVIGFVINRVHGDFAALKSGSAWLEQQTGKPVLAMLPFLQNLNDDPASGIDSLTNVAQLVLDALASSALGQQTVRTEPFTEEETCGVYRAIRERRDMRHFLSDPLDPAQLLRFIQAAHQGPSVGYMQPWRFIRVVDVALRKQIHQHVDQEREHTAAALGERGKDFMRLKVEGLLSCAELLVVGLADKREDYIFGRRTMPEMDLASASCAIQNFWLAARAEGIGVGWVSLFDPEFVRNLCGMPPGSKPIALLCVGHVAEFYAAPMLELEGWDKRRLLRDLVYENCWGNTAAD